jgi:DnaJ-class molecular chaperone
MKTRKKKMIKQTNMNTNEICKCCNGNGTQMNMYTGLLNYCPCCNGTGRKNEHSELIITCGG